MFEKYSEHARSVMNRARQEAQAMRHDHIGTEHILLGLIEEKQGYAADILSHRDIDLPHAKEQVDKLVSHGSGPEDGDYETLPRTTHAQNVLEDALNEARELKSSLISSEHILLGMLYENEGVGAAVLRNLGLQLDEVRSEILDLISRGKPSFDQDQGE